MKKIFLILFFVLFFKQTVFATTAIPKVVSIDPIDAKAGDSIKINALVYNNQKDNIIFIVEFKSGETSLGKPTATITPFSAKTLSIDWKYPTEKTDIAVTVVSAIDKRKKEITELHGILGNITIGQIGDNEISSGFSNLEKKTKTFFYYLRDNIEIFRKKQAEHFSLTRDKVRVNLGLDPESDLLKKTTPAPTPIPGTLEDEGLFVKKIDNPLDYGKLVFATSAASLFSSVWMFYGILFFLIFIILRFIFRAFV